MSSLRRTPPTSLQQWLVTCAVLWFITGLFLDGWAHLHIPELETFFTPWHGILYSGYFLSTITILGITLWNRRAQRGSFSSAIPLGYGCALIGAIIFAAGGVGDLVWHETFGIEGGIEALLSPTHLLLATGGFLIITANLRAWMLDRSSIKTSAFMDHVPVLFSATCGLALVSFFMQFSHYITVRAGGAFPGMEITELMQTAAITGYLFDTILLIGTLLFITRRGMLPLGSHTFVIVLSTLAMAAMRDGLFLLPSAIVTGIVADIIGRKNFPFEEHVQRVRVFSFVVPTTLFIGYFSTIMMTNGIWWSVHLWTGSIVMAGLAGLLLSYCFLSPREVYSLRA
ncbi:MAG: hypothetical protein Greene041662_223 [Candidatus Peregrinibacteria bacterium Greene0416_62]|nr:MAG: hypothetical protein Greene041662_223 [Candidatus Peregrinibacteria bacterium Greene0416_62]TSC98742.1 MAG: hypothetical protein Greene101449_875 [Candidatus Peregrinibacteria bacterium Greene1014_49]